MSDRKRKQMRGKRFAREKRMHARRFALQVPVWIVRRRWKHLVNRRKVKTVRIGVPETLSRQMERTAKVTTMS